MSSSSSQDVICTLKEKAPLRDFLRSKIGSLPSGDSFTYTEIQSALSRIIEEEKLFDATNPAIVLCDEALQEALDVKAFHISELKHYLSKQFLYIKQEKGHDDPSPAAPLEELSSPSSSQPKEEAASKVEGSFVISKELRETFMRLPDFKKDQSLFEYNEILLYLSKYIIINREKFFDPKNVKVAFIENDPLEKAFKVKTFHRIQVTALLDREINRVPTISEVKVEDLTCENENENRKRPLEEAAEHSSPPKRIRRLSTYTVSVLGYKSTDEETIYSAQGYETAAMGDGSNGEGSSSSEDEDAMVYTAEYELNEDEDMDKNQRDTGSSDEDSELEDVVLQVTVFDLMEEENEFWADSESDLEEEEGESRESSKSDLKCCKCGEGSKVILLYCKPCWQERKESFPPRENPRKKRVSQKPPPRNGAVVRPSYLRSVSNISSSSRMYESQDSGVGSQESLFSEKSPEVSSEENDSEEGGCLPHLKQRRGLLGAGSSGEGCSFCLRRPKNATLIHGNIGHTICCYPCAKKLWKDQRPCPICRRKIEKFVLNIEA